MIIFVILTLLLLALGSLNFLLSLCAFVGDGNRIISAKFLFSMLICVVGMWYLHHNLSVSLCCWVMSALLTGYVYATAAADNADDF